MNRLKYNINLAKELAWTDFKLKYYGSVLGLFWTFLKPFLMLIILYIVFSEFIKVNIENYHIYLLLGIVLWNFFADGTKDSMMGIRNKSQIVENTGITGEVIVLSICLHSFLTFLLNLFIFLLVYLALGFTFSLSAVTMVYIIAMYVVLIVGVSFFTSLMNMRFTDFSHIWDVFLQLLFWGTPIVYSYAAVPESLSRFFLLNPVSRIIVDARNSVIYQFFPEARQLAITTVIVFSIFLAGLYTFRRLYKGQVDRL